MREKPDIQENELLVIRSSDGDRFRKRLRVVERIVNGTALAPRIENRMWRDEDGHPHGRIIGMDFGDAEAIVKNWDQIRQCWFGK